MKAFITINQKAFAQLAAASKVKIDLKDAAIFRYIFDFSLSTKTEKKLIDNELYTWIAYKKIIDDNPLLGISNKKVIQRRIDKLIKLKLLDKYFSKEDGSKVFIKITDFAFKLLIECEDIDELRRKFVEIDNKDTSPKKRGKQENKKCMDFNLGTEKYHPYGLKSTTPYGLLSTTIDSYNIDSYNSLLEFAQKNNSDSVKKQKEKKEDESVNKSKDLLASRDRNSSLTNLQENNNLISVKDTFNSNKQKEEKENINNYKNKLKVLDFKRLAKLELQYIGSKARISNYDLQELEDLLKDLSLKEIKNIIHSYKLFYEEECNTNKDIKYIKNLVNFTFDYISTHRNNKTGSKTHKNNPNFNEGGSTYVFG